MAITTQDIHAVADKIVSEGGNPTLSEVRKALGGGSFTTISDAMKEWKSKHHAQATPIREVAPAAVVERLTDFGSEVWSIALEMANARLQSEREALELARQEMELTQQEAIELADQLNVELEQAQATIENQTSQIARVEAEAKDRMVDLEVEREERYKAERRAETSTAALSETHEQIKALNAQINEIKSENKRIRAEGEENYKRAVNVESSLLISNERLGATRVEAERLAAALSEKEEIIKDLTNRFEVEQNKAIESAKLAKMLEGTIAGMKDQSDLYNAYIGLVKKVDQQS